MNRLIRIVCETYFCQLVCKKCGRVEEQRLTRN